MSEKCFLVEGEKNVSELIVSDFEVNRVLISQDVADRSPELRNHPSAIITPSRIINDLSTLSINDRALAVAVSKEFALGTLDENKLIFCLDGVNDPGNLGTIIRTLDWFGFDQVVCSEDTVEFYNPKVISSSMGSFARLKVYSCDLPSFIRSFQGRKIGAEMTGKKLESWEPEIPGLVCLGSESHGIRTEIKELLDETITIERIGRAESLNVGIATGIICHHIAGTL